MLSIERKNVNDGYNPANCVWMPLNEQANNRRTSIRIKYNGNTRNIAQLAKENNISYHTLRSRLMVLGWEVEKAISTPTLKKGGDAKDAK